MIKMIVSGGQTGADQAGWRAAKRFGIATGGWMPRGFLTEDGPHPEFAQMYGASEHPKKDYPSRTISNVGLADITLLFGDGGTPGASLLSRIADDINHPYMLIRHSSSASPGYVFTYFTKRYGGDNPVLNIAGNRESKAPGIGQWVEEWLCQLFIRMGYKETSSASL